MNRIKELRNEKKLTLNKMSTMLQKNYNVSISDGQLSNYENGKRAPRDPKLWEQIADFFNVSVSYLMGHSDYRQEPEKDIQLEIQSINEKLAEVDKEISLYKTIYEDLYEEYEKSSFNTLDNTLLITLLDDGIQKDTDIQSLYNSKLSELENSLEPLNKERTILLHNLDTKYEILNNLKQGLIFSTRDRINPEFEKNGISQDQLSKNLSTLPYLLNYESTMKIVEYADLLLGKEENKFNP
ncbi:helix-turn-helix domain-containing protein [Vagococcus fluvialis]|uniref:helix-turn-helix domain-containing protein n=1 Tax=Vagococcus fluvialis TaxID=2738 RepID=UPI003D0B6B82